MTTRRRGGIITLAKLAVSGALLAYLVRKGSLGAVERALTHASPKWIALGFGLGVLGALVTIWQWWGVLRSLGLRRTYRRCFRLELAGDVFDAALPSSIGGDVLRAVTVAERSDERQVGVASVVLRRLCNFPGMVVLMGLGTGVTWAGGQVNRAWPAVLVALAFGFAGGIGEGETALATARQGAGDARGLQGPQGGSECCRGAGMPVLVLCRDQPVVLHAGSRGRPRPPGVRRRGRHGHQPGHDVAYRHGRLRFARGYV